VKNDTLYIPLPDQAPVEKEIEPGVIEPLTDEANDSVSPWWWAVLGVIALALVL
jgi:hypothetical protein